MAAVPCWVGTGDTPFLGWLTLSAVAPAGSGVVLVPPVGYEYWPAHRTMRAMAEALDALGVASIRIDLPATGDAAGRPTDPGIWPRWRSAVVEATDELRRAGCTRVGLLGVRAGATLALLEGAAAHADAVAAWAPIGAGRRYVRELRMLGGPVPGHEGAVAVAGSILSSETLDDLARLTPAAIVDVPAPHVLVAPRADRPADATLVEHLRTLGGDVTCVPVDGSESVLDRPTEYATVPEDIVATLTGWIAERLAAVARPTAAGPGAPDGRPIGTAPPPVHAVAAPAARGAGHDQVAPRSAAVVAWGGGRVSEDVVVVGPDDLVAVRTGPVGEPGATASPLTLVWLNTGSEHHVGPGRAWVELTRELALSGYTSLRVDFSGFGDSPDHGHAPGRPYDAHTVGETERLVAWLHDRGQPTVLVGLCASAWVALRAAAYGTGPGPAGVLAVNPQLYWQPGDPVEADIVGETHVRRLPEIERWHRLARWRVWSGLDAVGLRHPAAAWLRRLGRRRVPVLAFFAAGDDGLGFLDDRVARAWRQARRRGRITLVVDDELDHGLHRAWDRHRLLDALRPWLDDLAADGGPARPVVGAGRAAVATAPDEPVAAGRA